MSLIDRLGGQRNAGLAAAGVGGIVVVFVGLRHRKGKTQTAAAAQQGQSTAQGYAQTAWDPNQLYTGYDQLQQQIDSLRGQQGAGNPNPAPVAAPVPTAAPSPAAPVPAAPPPSAAPPPPSTPSSQRVYTVRRGDTLWGIAQRFYGSGSQWKKLYANNRAVVGSNPNLIRPGEKLRY